MVDYYKVLELQRSASQDDIKKSYHRLALKWHPDKNLANKEEAEKKFKAVTEAYKILSDPKKRSDYDRSIKETRSHIGRSAKGDHNNCFDIAYVFRDPKDIFKEAFGGTDLFNNIRNNGRGTSGKIPIFCSSMVWEPEGALQALEPWGLQRICEFGAQRLLFWAGQTRIRISTNILCAHYMRWPFAFT
uniref:DnaJ heat shock protein family (Hsp40) member B8 n=1 Tax=Coturnix japonica TaxID=93934 RepID=A0A8C2TPZ5_COTJA